ncbi:uracil-xanthine permease family protein [Falsiroseomonas tokyonensis]|uniref:Uracil-xanthine permease family protein n=1 Tax=Falsiroseomonas tokyonensis TaxID=430521 RepID=A0ABV7BN07_9PROT|nr:solute carrier family 23 protein [Falsiroseomonas tokyonensis]MBU8536973.1 xanthine permease [Falsiroseomonas tokyonensis]
MTEQTVRAAAPPATGWGLHSAPPASVLWPAALQHIGLGSVTLVFPLVVADTAGADAATLSSYLSLAMLALGLATLLQAWGRPIWGGTTIGSGFLLPAVFTAIYLPPTLIAAQLGGLSAVAGMTIVAGLTQLVLSFAVQRLRPWLPTELVGLVVLMIGVSLGLLALRMMLGFGPGLDRGTDDLLATAVALAVIIGVSVWGGPRLRPIAVLGGLVLGFAVHVMVTQLRGTPLLPVPIIWQFPSWPLATPSLDWTLLPGFAMGALACLVRVCGDVVACQRATDPNWRRPDYAQMKAGALADGLGTCLAGLLGVPGTNSYTASVGLSIATGVTARRVGLAVGVLWIVLAIVPGTAEVVLAVPRGVLGAALFFAAAFITVTGMGIVTQRLMDARRTLVVGAALVIGLSYDAAPQIFAGLPQAARLLVSSSLVLGMVAALLLVAAFRMGTAQQRRLLWRPQDGAAALQDFARQSGAAWGARAEVVARLEAALEEVAHALPGLLGPQGAVEVTARFDEFNLDTTLRWAGEALLPAGLPPTLEEAEDAALAARLAAVMLRRAADRVAEGRLADGRQELRLHYDH